MAPFYEDEVKSVDGDGDSHPHQDIGDHGKRGYALDEAGEWEVKLGLMDGLDCPHRAAPDDRNQDHNQEYNQHDRGGEKHAVDNCVYQEKVSIHRGQVDDGDGRSAEGVCIHRGQVDDGDGRSADLLDDDAIHRGQVDDGDGRSADVLDDDGGYPKQCQIIGTAR
ncbi:hypothetical protein CBR_g10800 [Chara braunii]|uniref:Uncharacterized protein n=1 Tax=Chara braunii TaxID=69332 RepID=A0A388KP87_CHABU|nr:hypothetical protein CBR_g10800 [Chara braunii]|eukprot:GBG71862.1 hypothetical protein CBR_g10800 [Chara braunii]